MEYKRFDYCTLSDEQLIIISQIIPGKSVVDFGCGLLSLSKHLLKYKPQKITGVDKLQYSEIKSIPGIEIINSYFSKCENMYGDVALVSWAVNNSESMRDLVNLLPKFKVIIYIGLNDGSTMCGTPELFKYLTTREILSYTPDRNNLILYSDKNRTQEVVIEEKYGLELSI